jgi:hypothetical protein
VDVTSGATHYWQLPGHFPGEPIFVGRPGARREDDGVLLVVVLAGGCVGGGRGGGTGGPVLSGWSYDWCCTGGQTQDY